MNKVKDSNQNIAKAVLKIRQDNKLSQEQFAEMAGVTRQAVSRWEMGVSVPNINALILISEKFDIPVDEMLKSGEIIKKKKGAIRSMPEPEQIEEMIKNGSQN